MAKYEIEIKKAGASFGVVIFWIAIIISALWICGHGF
jgi:hypothetical protein